LGFGDWGLGPIPNPQSPIPNPQSPMSNIFYSFIKNIKNNLFKLISIIKVIIIFKNGF